MFKPVVALQDFLDNTSVIWNTNGNQPALDSQASKELANFVRPESIGTAYSQALMLFEAAADYGFALVKILTEPIEAVAPWSCARSILETSSLATWLWDVKLNARQRVQRSLAFRHEGLRQQLKFAQATKGELDPNKTIARLKEVEKIAVELGIAQVVQKKGNKQVVFSKPMPTITEVITEIADEQVNYRLLSAMVHGHFWALQPLSFGNVVESRNIFDGVKGKYVEKQLDYTAISYLCVTSVNSLSRSIFMKFQLFGWNLQPMIHVRDKAITEIKDSYLSL